MRQVFIKHQIQEGPMTIVKPFEEVEPFYTIRGVYVDGYVVVKNRKGEILKYHKESIYEIV